MVLIKVMAEFFSIRSYSLVVIVKMEGPFAVFTVSNAVILSLFKFEILQQYCKYHGNSKKSVIIIENIMGKILGQLLISVMALIRA